MSQPQTYYQPGEQRASRVRELFDGIASRYDLVNDVQSFGLHRRWKRRLVDLVAPRPGERGLDICCGTGDIAQRLMRGGAAMCGLDVSLPMLALARQRTQRVQWIQGDAQALPFPDKYFDLVTVGYGLRNLADWRRGIAEMQRVSKPEARLAILDFGKPRNPLWRALYLAYLRRTTPWTGRLFYANPAAYTYIVESLENYPAQEGVAAELQRIGCAEVRTISLLGGIMSIHFAYV